MLKAVEEATPPGTTSSRYGFRARAGGSSCDHEGLPTTRFGLHAPLEPVTSLASVLQEKKDASGRRSCRASEIEKRVGLWEDGGTVEAGG